MRLIQDRAGNLMRYDKFYLSDESYFKKRDHDKYDSYIFYVLSKPVICLENNEILVITLGLPPDWSDLAPGGDILMTGLLLDLNELLMIELANNLDARRNELNTIEERLKDMHPDIEFQYEEIGDQLNDVIQEAISTAAFLEFLEKQGIEPPTDSEMEKLIEDIWEEYKEEMEEDEEDFK